ncbi:MAG: ATP-binding cassette domain-containing protein [Duncaniella sp.]|nr:ATP-binding cassette domain-containing protein [Duncaniella sp.]
MEEEFIISFDSERLGYGSVVLSNPGRFGIPEGVTVVLGENGSGKTTLGTILEKGRYAYGNRLGFRKDVAKVKMLSFTDIHSLSGMEVQYYEQRLEATMNDLVPTVREIMGDKAANPAWERLTSRLSLCDVMDKRVNYLSSGELRKLLLVNVLLALPDVLVLDNPYIGLDAASRVEFDNTLKAIVADGVSVVMLLCDGGDIPDYAGAVLTMDDCVITGLVTAADAIRQLRESETGDEFDADELPQRPCEFPVTGEHDVTFEIHDGHVRYGAREILRDVEWRVRHGERWTLTGPNGSGKSLLLSLVCADNPQAYANDITLFDRKRGSGESIWDIKDSIGYVSPEMQLYFKSASKVKEIVVQGMRNSLNRYKPVSDDERDTALAWLSLLDITHLADRRFSELSAGEQRLVLVARALIKQPPLLVLDEPLHGLDSRRKQRVKSIIDAVVCKNGSSLIFVTHYTGEIPSCVTFTKTLVKL